LDLTALPNSVVKHYRECAQKLDMSISEYLVLKLAHDCFVDVTVQMPPKRPGNGSAVYASTGNAAARSGYKGVYAYGKRWAAVVFNNGVRQRLGVWSTPEEAARAYDAHLVTSMGGDPNAAVNFPTDLDQLRSASTPFVERFATGVPLNDIEWGAWQRGTKGYAVPESEPLAVLPPTTSVAKVDAHTPLVDRPATTLYRRSDPVLPREDFVPPPLHDPDLPDPGQ
jgi:hypothetical protein